ncbi:MAG: hypothetical protein NPINA01_13090 [Nitrospinaceae bacterium]|nr:MAG: hypothetical protein NPINA01_13090 [Nitrospinaceae bacterium]
MSLTSSDLELTHDGGFHLNVGMRFNGVNIPQGATITSALGHDRGSGNRSADAGSHKGDKGVKSFLDYIYEEALKGSHESTFTDRV